MKALGYGLSVAAALLLVVLLQFAPWWAGDKVLAPLDLIDQLYAPWATNEVVPGVKNHFVTDAVEQYLPYRWLAYDAVQRGESLRWNPLNYGGTAQYANTMGSYFDWSYLLYRIFPFWSAWHLTLILQMGISGLGMYLLLRARAIGVVSAFVGSACYSLNGQFLIHVYHGWLLGSFCWLPWTVWAIHMYRSGRSAIWPLIPVSIALSFLGGQLQFVVFHIFVLLCLWISVKDRGWTGRMSVWTALAFGLSAVMLVPTVWSYWISWSAGLQRGGFGYPGGWTQPILNLLAYPTYLFPSIMGNAHTFDLYKVFKSDLNYVPFIGTALLICSIPALMDRNSPAPARWIAWVGLLLPVTPLVGFLYQRLIILFVFAAIWLAVEWIERADESAWTRLSRWSVGVFVVASVCWALASVGIMMFHDRIHSQLSGLILGNITAHRFAAFPEWFDARLHHFISTRVLWSPGILIPWLLAGMSVLLMRVRFRGPFARKCFMPALGILLICELSWFARGWLVFEPQPDTAISSIYPARPEVDLLREHVGPLDRLVVFQSADQPPLFPPNVLSVYGIAEYDGYDSIIPNGMNRSRPVDDDATAWAEVGVTHVLARESRDLTGRGWRLLATMPPLSFYENPVARPRYFTERNGTVEAIPVIEHRTNRRLLEIPPGVDHVRVLENWDDGWRYHFVNEAPNRMTRTDNGSMKAVFPSFAEPRVLVLEYAPRALRLGGVLSSVSLIALILLYVIRPAWLHPRQS